jgi:hypothetical protein
MSHSVKPHLPLITNRIQFQFTTLPPPPSTTLRQDFGRRAIRQIRHNKTPYTRVHSRVCTPRRLTPVPDEGLSDCDSDLSDLSSLPDNDQEKAKIPKPPGEAGRKNSGGFNLEEALGWTEEKYNKLTVSCILINFWIVRLH